MRDDRGRRRADVETVDIVGGAEALELQLHAYDERWVGVFGEHRRRIREALAPPNGDGVVAIEHIGSTAVPGLAAKPIVDIVLVVADITAEEDYLEGLLAAGYELRVREPGHRLVRTPARDVHVHIYERDDPAVGEYLLLRDHLRADAADRALYENTKRELLTSGWDSMNDYADAKTEVIAAIKARARAARVASEETVAVELLAPTTALDVAAVHQLTNLVNEVYSESEAGLWLGDTGRTTESEFAGLIAAGQIAVARLGGRTVGSVRVQRLDEKTGEFGMLVAAPDVRGAGVGRELVAFAERWAVEQGFTELQLEVLSPRDWRHPSKEFLRTWYTRLGFEPVRQDSFAEAFPTLAAHLATPCVFTVYRKRLVMRDGADADPGETSIPAC